MISTRLTSASACRGTHNMDNGLTNLTFKQLFDHTIDHYSGKAKTKKCSESFLCEEIEKHIKAIFESIGKGYISHTREYTLLNGRADFIVRNNEDRYTIIEAKHSRKNTNYDVYFAMAIGQLMYYRMAMVTRYGIDKKNISLMIAIDEDSLPLHSIIGIESLDISVMVYGSDGVKIYGNS